MHDSVSEQEKRKKKYTRQRECEVLRETREKKMMNKCAHEQKG